MLSRIMPTPCATFAFAPNHQFFENYKFKHFPVVRAANEGARSAFCLWDDEARRAGSTRVSLAQGLHLMLAAAVGGFALHGALQPISCLLGSRHPSTLTGCHHASRKV